MKKLRRKLKRSLCNYTLEQYYFTNSIVSSKTQTLLNGHGISNQSQRTQRFFASGKFRSYHGHFHLYLSGIQNTQQCSFVVHLSLLASQRQNGRRQHLKSFRQKLITCAILWDSLPKHCMDDKKLGGFQAGGN